MSVQSSISSSCRAFACSLTEHFTDWPALAGLPFIPFCWPAARGGAFMAALASWTQPLAERSIPRSSGSDEIGETHASERPKRPAKASRRVAQDEASRRIRYIVRDNAAPGRFFFLAADAPPAACCLPLTHLRHCPGGRCEDCPRCQPTIACDRAARSAVAARAE